MDYGMSSGTGEKGRVCMGERVCLAIIPGAATWRGVVGTLRPPGESS